MRANKQIKGEKKWFADLFSDKVDQRNWYWECTPGLEEKCLFIVDPSALSWNINPSNFVIYYKISALIFSLTLQFQQSWLHPAGRKKNSLYIQHEINFFFIAIYVWLFFFYFTEKRKKFNWWSFCYFFFFFIQTNKK